jgi:D-alanine-D-alanine ligase
LKQMKSTNADELRKQFHEKRIAVLMGGLSSERDISIKTGGAILNALQRLGYDAISLDADKNIAESLKTNGIDIAFIALHGAFGEDGVVQGLLELLGIAYTGSGVLASAISINKVATKKMLAYHGLPTPAFQVVHAHDGDVAGAVKSITLPIPFVVKPPEEGSTIGISIVTNNARIAEAVSLAAQYDCELLIEEFVKGRELTAAVLNGKPLPLVEIVAKNGFYDFEAKYNSQGTTQYVVAPAIGAELTQQIQKLAVETYTVLGCSGAARVDFLLTPDGKPSILEINTIPGMTETSLLPKAAGHAGIDFENLVEQILWSARLHKRALG